MESEKHYASASSSLTPTSSSSSSFSSPSEEIEAAETLAYLSRLAMRRHTTHSTDNCCTKRFNLDSPIPHSDLPPPSRGQAVAGDQQLDEKISCTTSIETERNQQNDRLRKFKVEQDADLSKTSHCNKSRRDLTEEEKEARRIRRVLANRESARQTIRRRQALSEELSRKAATLVLENENLKRVCYYSIVVPSYNEANLFLSSFYTFFLFILLCLFVWCIYFRHYHFSLNFIFDIFLIIHSVVAFRVKRRRSWL
ncbi:hypothetical protein KIW84_031363 [Lathyrus oleraceus]|uniref:BZIP domain-containing protein n=1 Tax=Pisum sativum TaxID=3888 RepID=A0A9D5AXC9_PEA|nr:hypothetical protein KIW84_031363 [Pisum sativum]